MAFLTLAVFVAGVGTGMKVNSELPDPCPSPEPEIKLVYIYMMEVPYLDSDFRGDRVLVHALENVAILFDPHVPPDPDDQVVHVSQNDLRAGSIGHLDHIAVTNSLASNTSDRARRRVKGEVRAFDVRSRGDLAQVFRVP